LNDVTVRWNGVRRFVGYNDLGHSIVMDSPTEYGGENTGMRPLELVLYGLAGCTGMDVVSILEKQRQKVTAISVKAVGRQREERPARYESIDVVYEITGVGVKPEFVARAIALSEEKYCSVRACLAPEIEVTSSFSVVEEPACG
jgi:putative redox protein